MTMIGSKTPQTQSTASLSSACSEGSISSGADKANTTKVDIAFVSQDDRPFIEDLLVEHSSDIATVRAALQQTRPSALYDPSRHDDIWILRFVMSHKTDIDAASRAAIETIEFRREYKLDDVDLRGLIKHLDGVTEVGYGLPHNEKMEACSRKYVSINVLPDVNRGPIMYVFMDKIDMNKLNDIATQEDLKNSYIYGNEALYQVLDGITRKTGRLTKLIKVVDLGGVALRKMNRGYLSKDSAAAKEIDDYFPQLLGGMFILHSPKWINVIWKFARPLMPKRVVEKIDFLPKNMEKVQGIMARFVSKENLLEQYGGENNEWPPPRYLGSYFK